MDADWARLAAQVRQRRTELGLSQAVVSARAGYGLSLATLRNIEQARSHPFRASTLATLERVLGWEKGAAQVVLGGGVPVLASDGVSAEERLERLETVLDRILATTPAPVARAKYRGGVTKSVRLPAEVWDALELEAEDRGVSLAEVVRDAVNKFLGLL